MRMQCLAECLASLSSHRAQRQPGRELGVALARLRKLCVNDLYASDMLCVQTMVYSGANGLGLALVIPATQSLVADLYPPEARGRAFGFLLLFSGMGAWSRTC